MAGKYRILSAGSERGESLRIPVAWELEEPKRDLLVLVVPPSGVPELCSYWEWRDGESCVEIKNLTGYKSWKAYVSRAEYAEELAQLTETGEVEITSVLEQFKKNVRILEQLQAEDGRTLKSPDPVGGMLPAKEGRANYILSFDEEGMPQCVTNFEEVTEAKNAAKNAAVEAKERADMLAGEALSYKAEAESFARSAKEHADTASAKALEAGTYAYSAKREAEGVGESVSVSKGACENAALSALESAKNAAISASEALENAGNIGAYAFENVKIKVSDTEGEYAYIVVKKGEDGTLSLGILKQEELNQKGV